VSTTLVNTLSTGSNGATLTTGNTAGTGQNAADAIQTGGGFGSVTFDSTHVHSPDTLSCKITPASTTFTYFQWSTSLGGGLNPFTQLWFRQYLYFTANPAALVGVLKLEHVATQTCQIAITTGGQVRALDGGNGGIFTTTASIALNQFIRIEGFCIGDPSVGQVEVKLFNSADSTTPTETKTSAANVNTTGTMGTGQWGCPSFIGSLTDPYWQADIGVSDAGYLGPTNPASYTGGVNPALFP